MKLGRRLRARIAGAVLAAMLMCPRFARADPDTLSLPVDKRALANGLRVVLAPDPSLPDVSVVVRYDVGSADDPDGLEGLAHLVEHLAFAGSRDVGPGDHARLLAQIGATGVEGRTGLDSTDFMESVPPEGLERALWLEANRMGFLRDFVQSSAVDRERTIVAHEYRLRVLDTVLGSLGVFAWNELYPAWHPYRFARDGLSSIDRAGVADVRAFLRTWYTPSNATVVIVGKFDPASAMAFAERYFGSLPSSAAPRRPFLPAVPAPGNLWLEVEAGTTAEYAAMSWPTPSLGDPADRALDVAARLLAGPHGWLTRKFVEGDGPALAITAREASFRRGSVFGVTIHPTETAGLADLIRSVQAAMSDFEDSLTAAAVDQARKWFADRQRLSIEGSMARALRLAESGSWGLQDYDTVDAPAVAEAVRQYLTSTERVTMVVRQRMEILPAGVRGVLTHRDRMEP